MLSSVYSLLLFNCNKFAYHPVMPLLYIHSKGLVSEFQRDISSSVFKIIALFIIAQMCMDRRVNTNNSEYAWKGLFLSGMVFF